MTVRPRFLAVLAALVLFGAALWTLISTGSGEPAASLSPSVPSRSAKRAATPAGGGVSVQGDSVAAAEHDQAARKLRGRVVDPDGAPVEYGSISVTCLQDDGTATSVPGGVARLGLGGEFVVPVCEGRNCVRLHHPTMVPASPWMLERGRSPTLVARPMPALFGRVLGPDGTAVVGATIDIAPPAEEADPDGLPPFTTRLTTTDGDGVFKLVRLERPPCGPCDRACRTDADDELFLWPRVAIAARAPDHRPVEIVIDVDASYGEDDPLVLTLGEPLAPIRGRVVAAPSRSGVFVLARSEVRPYEQHRVDVDEGAFELHGLGTGPYTLRALHNGVELDRIEGVEAGARVTLEERDFPQPPASTHPQ